MEKNDMNSSAEKENEKSKAEKNKAEIKKRIPNTISKLFVKEQFSQIY
jgi:hypothetical protein